MNKKCKSCGGETRIQKYKEDGEYYDVWVCNSCGDWGEPDTE